VRFPDVDFAALGRALGLEAMTVRTAADLEGLRAWVRQGATAAMVLDAKVVPTVIAEWLEEAFRGH
jgi:TPP-dependent trihydroxycyclohexane-1,2-dione (THcHDO) dehydratase